MDASPRPVVAGFDARNSAERAADELLKWGLNDDDVVVAVRDHDYAAADGVMVRSEEEDAIAHLTHLIGLAGVLEDEARRLALRFDSSDAVVAVDAEDRFDEVQRILRDHGGQFDGPDAFDRPDWEEARRVLRGHWELRSGANDPAWKEAEGGYHYIYERAAEPDFRGRSWVSAEPKLQSGFEGWMAERGYRTQANTWDWLKETLHEIWTPAARGASPDDITHPERLHRWVRLTRASPVPDERS
ncbi:MAG: hypothetical protein WBW04_14720 [Nitrolancea sp.]